VHVWSKRDEHIDDTYYHKKNIPSGRAGCTSRHSACWCSRPTWCSAERKQCRSPKTPGRRRSPQHQEGEDEASSRAAATLPKNVIAGLHPSRRTRGRQRFRGLLFPSLCAQEQEQGKTVRQQKQWNCCVSVRRKSDQQTLLSCACGRLSAGGALSFPRCHQSPETPKLRRKLPQLLAETPNLNKVTPACLDRQNITCMHVC